jgi:hypothetical protein
VDAGVCKERNWDRHKSSTAAQQQMRSVAKGAGWQMRRRSGSGRPAHERFNAEMTADRCGSSSPWPEQVIGSRERDGSIRSQGMGEGTQYRQTRGKFVGDFLAGRARGEARH